MDKKKVTLIIVGTLLAMALVAALLVLWLVPANQTDAPQQTNGSVITEDPTGEQNSDETQDATEGAVNEPTVGVDVEIPGTTSGESGNNSGSGSTGNGGSGNGNTGNNGGNNEIDFDDLLGNA